MEDERPARRLAEVVGANARIRRQELEVTQEEVATQMRNMGLRWGRPAVAALEAGKRDLDAGEFFLLAEALDMPPAKLLRAPDDDQIVIGGCRLPGELLARLPLEAGTKTGLQEEIAQANAIYEAEWTRELAHRYGLHQHVDAMRALRGTGEAERRAAVRINKALGLAKAEERVTGFEVSCAAVSLWGHGLTDERDRVKGRGARGHASRRLDEVLTERIARVRGLNPS